MEFRTGLVLDCTHLQPLALLLTLVAVHADKFYMTERR